MRKTILILMFLLLNAIAFSAWDNTLPADSSVWNDAAGFIRDNWDALEVALGTDLDGAGDIWPWFDVTSSDFGATGDGSTDDTTAINLATTAADDAGGGTVYIPKGTYKVTAAITLHSNTVLWMDEAAVISRQFAGRRPTGGTIVNATQDMSNRDENITIIGGRLYSPVNTWTGEHVAYGVQFMRFRPEIKCLIRVGQSHISHLAQLTVTPDRPRIRDNIRQCLLRVMYDHITDY